MKRSPPLVAAAFAFALLVPALGYVYLGLFYAIIFLVGYVGGFAFWMMTSKRTAWPSIRLPYWLTLIAFALHKLEENRAGFFEAVSTKITGIPVPEVSVGLIVGLLPIGAWLAIPPLVHRHYEFGSFLAWTFFASMGLTELAHFIVPLLAGHTYSYFPGMVSALLLAPLAWWGMWRLKNGIAS